MIACQRRFAPTRNGQLVATAQHYQSQGKFEAGLPDGAPAMPNTGSLVEVNSDGTFTVIMEGLNQPTSLEFIGNTAYVVSLAGEIYKIDNVSSPPYGTSKN